MRMKVKLQFVEPWSSIISDVALQCGLSADEYCRRAVQVFTKKGLDEGAAQNEGSNESTGDGTEVRTSPRTDSDVLADSGNP